MTTNPLSTQRRGPPRPKENWRLRMRCASSTPASVELRIPRIDAFYLLILKWNWWAVYPPNFPLTSLILQDFQRDGCAEAPKKARKSASQLRYRCIRLRPIGLLLVQPAAVPRQSSRSSKHLNSFSPVPVVDCSSRNSASLPAPSKCRQANAEPRFKRPSGLGCRFLSRCPRWLQIFAVRRLEAPATRSPSTKGFGLFSQLRWTWAKS
jgi:hypothetical protein